MLLNRRWATTMVAAMVALLLLALPGPAWARQGAESLVLWRYADSGLTLLAQAGRGEPLREIGVVPEIKPPSTPAEIAYSQPRGLSRGICAPSAPSGIVCLRGNQIVAGTLMGAPLTPVHEVKVGPDARTTLYVGAAGTVYVAETIGDPFGPDAVRPEYRLGRVTRDPQPAYAPLGSGDTFRGVEVVGDSPARSALYATALGGDPGRGDLWVLDRATGARQKTIFPFGDRERPGLGYGPMLVSPDGRWLLVGSGPPIELPGYPKGQAYLYDLDQPAPAPQGIVLPTELEPSGFAWLPDGRAVIVANWPSWKPESSGPGTIYRLDPATLAVTPVAETTGPNAAPAALDSAGQRLALEYWDYQGPGRITRIEVVALADGSRYAVDAPSATVLGWLVVP